MNCSEFQRLSAQGAQLSGDAQLREQWELHLIICASCAETFTASQSLTSADAENFRQSVMAQTITQRDVLNSRLAELRERQAPPELLAGVLRQTTGRETDMPAPARRSRQRWAFVQNIMLRPRIALEASFALSCCWLLVFGMPSGLAISTVSADEQLQQPLAASRRKIEEFQQDMAVLLRGIQSESRQGEIQ